MEAAHGPRGEFRGVWPARRVWRALSPDSRALGRDGVKVKAAGSAPNVPTSLLRDWSSGLARAPEGHGVAVQAPRPYYLPVSGQPEARPSLRLAGPLAFDRLNYGSQRFSQVRESRGGPAGQIFLPLVTLPRLMPDAPVAIFPSEDTGHHAPWDCTQHSRLGDYSIVLSPSVVGNPAIRCSSSL